MMKWKRKGGAWRVYLEGISGKVVEIPPNEKHYYPVYRASLSPSPGVWIELKNGLKRDWKTKGKAKGRLELEIRERAIRKRKEKLEAERIKQWTRASPTFVR